MKLFFILSFSFFLHTILISQVVVKMDMASQSTDPMTAITLFDESLPGNIPSVLGPMGYDVAGGTPPYTFTWLENGTILSEESIAVITPQTGSTYEVLIVDQNNCSVLLPVKTATSLNERSIEETLSKVSVYLSANNQVEVKFSQPILKQVSVELYDMKGVKHYEEIITGDATFPVNVKSGIYILFIRSIELSHVEMLIFP